MIRRSRRSKIQHRASLKLRIKFLSFPDLNQRIKHLKFFETELDYPVKPDNDDNGNRVRYGYSEQKNNHFAVVTSMQQKNILDYLEKTIEGAPIITVPAG